MAACWGDAHCYRPTSCALTGAELSQETAPTQQHVDTHHLKHTGEKPYKCTWPDCGYASTTQQNVDTHYLKHTGERPYKCTSPGCTFATVTRWHLNRHIAQRHQ